MNDISQLELKFCLEDDATPEEQEVFGRDLRNAILEHGAASVESVFADDLPGAKGLSPDTNTLLITVLGSSSVLVPILTAISGMFSDRSKWNVTLKLNGNEISVPNPSDEDKRQLIHAWATNLKAQSK